MHEDDITLAGDELYAALRERHTVAPLTSRYTGMNLADAYRVSEHLLSRRLASGETVVGRKIGLTSKAVQRQLGVDQPDFGMLTDRMQYADGAEVPISTTLIQPKAEGEIAFVLKADLAGPGVTEAQVLAATDYVSPCFEIVDSRIRDWQIRLEDTVADNASCGLFVLGHDKADPNSLDLSAVHMRIETDGELVATGSGAAALGNPLTCVAWLANTMSAYGTRLAAGDIVLSGSLGPFVPAEPGTTMRVAISDIGGATLRCR